VNSFAAASYPRPVLEELRPLPAMPGAAANATVSEGPREENVFEIRRPRHRRGSGRDIHHYEIAEGSIQGNGGWLESAGTAKRRSGTTETHRVVELTFGRESQGIACHFTHVNRPGDGLGRQGESCREVLPETKNSAMLSVFAETPGKEVRPSPSAVRRRTFSWW
jgi:hypothetical protein